MNTIIMGAGKVGFHVAEILATEGHNLTIIENIKEREKEAKERIDAMVLYGHGATEKLLRRAGIDKTDLFIAATDRDEVNILACLMAKEYGVKQKLARINNENYCLPDGKLTSLELGIDHLINPRNVVASEICRMIHYSKATDVTELADGRVLFLSYLIAYDSPIAGISIAELAGEKTKAKVIFVAINRHDQIISPSGKDRLKIGDIISFVCKKEDLTAMRELFGFEVNQAKSIVILGAGEVGVEVARRLSQDKHNSIKVLDRSPERCEEVSEEIDNAMVLCCESTDAETLRMEGVGNSDVFIAITADDQANILGAQLARYHGAKRSMAIVNQRELMKLATKLRVDACINSRQTIASAMLRHIRGENVLALSRLHRSNAELIEVAIPENSKIVGKTIKKINAPRGVIIAAILREDAIIIPSLDDVILANDHIAIFSMTDSAFKVETLLS